VSSYAGSSDGVLRVVRVAGEYSPATLLKRDAGQHFRLNLYDLAPPDLSSAPLVGAAGESGTTHRGIREYAHSESACRATLPSDVPLFRPLLANNTSRVVHTVQSSRSRVY